MSFHFRRAGGGRTKGRAGGNVVKPGFPAKKIDTFRKNGSKVNDIFLLNKNITRNRIKSLKKIYIIYFIMSLNLNVAACLCIKNCEEFLPKIFDNLNLLGGCFSNFNVIFVYDNCLDNSEILLEEYKKTSKFEVYVIHCQDNNSPYRTIRIANARNKCMDAIFNKIKNIDYHFMIDADDVNCNVWNVNIIKDYFNRNDWDALSFNRKDYYDIWALMYDNFKHHSLGYFNGILDCHEIVCYMKNDISKKLDEIKDDELFECISAFNGFAIYRTHMFYNTYYDGEYDNIKMYISEKDREETLEFINNILQCNPSINKNFIEQCEHLFFHIRAIKKNNARIRISKKIMFLD